ncbi:MAG: hypothetical protein QF362_00385 [Candidatus Woesearchaeota archaeon]|jgi:hypothetical protein|nr:hypothetical protein [Candidatus Woesearchaeota archaeon]
MLLTKKLEIELFFEIILFFAGVVIITIFFNNNILLTFLFIVIGVIRKIFWHKKHDVYYFVCGAIIGSLAEIICVYFGVWQYANPSFLGVPMWSPLAWGLVTMLVIQIAEKFIKMKMK